MRGSALSEATVSHGTNSRIHFLALTIAYAVFAYIGLKWAQVSGAGSPVWPAAGVALAGLILGGAHLWPAIFIGRLIAGYMAQSDQLLAAEVAIAAGNSLSAAVSCQALKWARVSDTLETLQDMLKYLVFGAILEPTISALFGATTLALTTGLSFENWWRVFSFWIVGGFVGIATIGPLLQYLAAARTETWTRAKLIRVAAPVVLTALFSCIVFTQTSLTYLKTWHTLPLMVWAALTHRISATAALAAVSFVAMWGNLHGATLFAASEASSFGQMVLLQQFIGIISLTILCLTAAEADRTATSQSELRLALEGADQGTFRFDGTARTLSWDKRGTQLLGLSADDQVISLDKLTSHAHPEDRNKLVHAISGALDPSGQGALDVDFRLDQSSPRWVALRGQTVFSGDGHRRRSKYMRGVVRDVTAEKESEHRRQLLARETVHRAKNQLAVIQSIAKRSLSGQRSLDEAREIFLGRIYAMAGGFNLLDEKTQGFVCVSTIIKRELNQFATRFTFDGADPLIKSEAVQSVGLMVHELATNAAKYGSLSGIAGTVHISTELNDQSFTFRWKEKTALLHVAANYLEQRPGFGSALLLRAIPMQLGGAATRVISEGGIVYELVCPRDKIIESAPDRYPRAEPNGT